jgi:hypothetical protein
MNHLMNGISQNEGLNFEYVSMIKATFSKKIT